MSSSEPEMSPTTTAVRMVSVTRRLWAIRMFPAGMPKTIADYRPQPEHAQGLRDYVTALAERYDGVSDLPGLPTSLEIDRDTDHGGVRPTARGICTAVARQGPRTLVSRAGGGQNACQPGDRPLGSQTLEHVCVLKRNDRRCPRFRRDRHR